MRCPGQENLSGKGTLCGNTEARKDVDDTQDCRQPGFSQEKAKTRHAATGPCTITSAWSNWDCKDPVQRWEPKTLLPRQKTKNESLQMNIGEALTIVVPEASMYRVLEWLWEAGLLANGPSLQSEKFPVVTSPWKLVTTRKSSHEKATSWHRALLCLIGCDCARHRRPIVWRSHTRCPCL